ncbi:MAG: FKBP-type peptidyl-prolyl cis-trans isomerase [Ignavibacteriota bacterium]
MKIIAAFLIVSFTALVGFAQNSATATSKVGAGVNPPETIITTPSGLKYIDLKVGSGAMPTSEQTVTVNCVGRLSDSTIFWSTLDPKFGPVQPLTSPLTRLIRGWQEGLLSMKVGGKRKLIIPPDLGYGVQGRPPAIPGNSTLVFEIDLLEIK